MRVVITGHTSGVGKCLYEHFLLKGHDVIGLSRSNGYDITTEQDKIVEIAKDCDLFINNAYSGDCQTELLEKLHDKVKNMIVVGSVVADWAKIWKEYGDNKERLQDKTRELALKLDNCNILYLKLSFCENASWPPNLEAKYKTTFVEIIKSVELWLEIPRITQIEFGLKVTDEIMEYARKMNPH